MGVILVVWFMTWTPYALAALCGFVPALRWALTPLASTIPGTICKLSAVLNPWIYGLG